jgi:glucan phosphorylase
VHEIQYSHTSINVLCLLGLQFADNKELQEEWWQAKRANKLKLVSYIKEKTGYVISPDALFDIQVSLLETSYLIMQ